MNIKIHTAPRWSREQIRAARIAPLAPLLRQRGFELIDLGAGNFHISSRPDILIKDSYWRSPDTGAAGNTIDFLTQILGMTFNEAMRACHTEKPNKP